MNSLQKLWFAPVRNSVSGNALISNKTKLKFAVAGTFAFMTVAAGSSYYQKHKEEQGPQENETSYSHRVISREEALTMMREFDEQKKKNTVVNEIELLGHKEDCDSCCFKQN